MGRARIWLFTGVLLILWGGVVAWGVAGPGLRLEGGLDALLHWLEHIGRMRLGETAHLDYRSATGDLALRPFLWAEALLQWLGIPVGPGRIFILGQALVLLAVLPGLIWIAATRLSLRVALVHAGLVIGAVVIVTPPSGWTQSVAEYATRWGWALCLLIVPVVVIPPRIRRADIGDGLVTGAALAALLLVQPTLALAFAPFAVLGFSVQFRARVMWVAAVIVLAVWGLYAVRFGAGYWWLTLGDFLTYDVSRMVALAADPVITLTPLLLALSTFAITLIAVIVLRRVSRGASLSLMFFLPGVVVAVLLEAGTAPYWLAIVAVCALALAGGDEFGADAPTLATGAAALAIAVAPMVLALGATLRPFLAGPEAFQTVFDASGAEDLRIARRYTDPPEGRMILSDTEATATCTLARGRLAALRRDAAALAALPGVDRQPLVADRVAGHWVFGGFAPAPGTGVEPLDGLVGIASARHVMVPKCPADPAWRDQIVIYLDESGIGLQSIAETDDFTLYELVF